MTDRLNDGSCETVLFPNTIEAVLLYEANVSLPFFNETITTITVRLIILIEFNQFLFAYRWISMDFCYCKVH